MAQFFNFKGDYFGLTDADIERNTEMYGYNVYTKQEKKQECFTPISILISPAFLLMLIAGIISFFGTNIFAGIVINSVTKSAADLKPKNSAMPTASANM